jgi:hypothetical protein
MKGVPGGSILGHRATVKLLKNHWFLLLFRDGGFPGGSLNGPRK